MPAADSNALHALRIPRNHDFQKGYKIMLVAIDGRLANTRRQLGVGVYCSELLRAMPAVRPDVTLRIYLDSPPLDMFPLNDSLADIRILPPCRGWAIRSLAAALRETPPDAFFAPMPQLPLTRPCPMAVTHHGLAYRVHPECFSWTQRMEGRLRTAHALRYADHLFAVSHTMKQEMIEYLGADPKRISVVHHGTPPGFLPTLPADEIERVRSAYNLPPNYLLMSARLSPRKNIVRIVAAYEQLRDRRPDIDHKLVIAGGDDWGAPAIHQRIAASNRREDIVTLGCVAHRDMPALTAGASASLLVSLWESFGVPLLEGMGAGVPVVAANCSAIPEITGPAALLVDPCDIEAISDALERVIVDEALRSDMIERGVARAQLFSWQNAARAVLERLDGLGA